MTKVVKMRAPSGKPNCKIVTAQPLCFSWGMTRIFLCIGLVALTACVDGLGQVGEGHKDGISSEIAVRPKARPEGLSAASANVKAPPKTARTAEAFDTTTAEQRDAALSVPEPTGEKSLGKTIASLGSPSEPGFWLKTPLVSAETQGRVVYPDTGKSVQVTLIPIDGPATAGSRMSLPALRLLDAPLTGLPEVDVYSDA